MLKLKLDCHVTMGAMSTGGLARRTRRAAKVPQGAVS